MKNTLMFLLVSLLLSFSLTACGGDSQQAAGDSGSQSSGVTGNNGSQGSAGSAVTGSSGSQGSAGSGVTGTDGSGENAGTMPEDSLADDARDALDDAGRAVRNAADGMDRDF